MFGLSAGGGHLPGVCAGAFVWRADARKDHDFERCGKERTGQGDRYDTSVFDGRGTGGQKHADPAFARGASMLAAWRLSDRHAMGRTAGLCASASSARGDGGLHGGQLRGHSRFGDHAAGQPSGGF